MFLVNLSFKFRFIDSRRSVFYFIGIIITAFSVNLPVKDMF